MVSLSYDYIFIHLNKSYISMFSHKQIKLQTIYIP